MLEIKNSEYLDPILDIEGFSKNHLKKIKKMMYSSGVKSFTVNNNIIECEINVGTLNYPFIFNISDINNVRKKFKSLFEITNMIKNNHKPYNHNFNDYLKFYKLHFYEIDGKKCLNYKYTFNSNIGDIIINNEQELYDILSKNVKYVSDDDISVISEDFLFISKGVLLKELPEISKRVFTESNHRKYLSTASLFTEWNNQYKILNEISIYSNSLKETKKQLFTEKLTANQKSWFIVFKNAHFPYTNINKSSYNVEKDLKDGIYLKEAFEKKYNITEELIEEYNKIFNN